MQQEIRFATFNVCNLALPGVKYYADQVPYSQAQYDAKTDWIAMQIDRLDADVIGFQEIFSQSALEEVLSKSQKYKDAHRIGFDADPSDMPQPRNALVSRLPVAPGAVAIAALPRGLLVPLPGVPEALSGFTRPVVHAKVIVSPQHAINVFVCHLKSKLPDYLDKEQHLDCGQAGLAALRSLIRRSTDALGLRLLASDTMARDRSPVIVMGDFNDVAAAVSTQIVMGAPHHHGDEFNRRLFDSHRIQLQPRSVRDIGYTHIHEGNHETVDHVLVSPHFIPESACAIGEVLEVIYVNDHLAMKFPEATDHGLVLVRIGLNSNLCDAPKNS